MTEEEKEKQLLLKDLCTRLPYGVICHNSNTESDFKLSDVSDIDSGSPTFDYGYGGLETVKPYLRPMSSMTEEEREKYNKLLDSLKVLTEDSPNLEDVVALIDWLDEKMLNYRKLKSMF